MTVKMHGIEALAWWPGLPRLWKQGSWTSLAESLGFAAALNLAIWLTWVAPTDTWRNWSPVVWSLLGCCWGVSFWRHAWTPLVVACEPVDAQYQGLFLQAQAEYLKGHWFEAEAVLRKILNAVPADVEAGLLLASLLRRSKRSEEARSELRRLSRLAAAEKWQMELARESQLLSVDDDRGERGGPVAAEPPPDRIPEANHSEAQRRPDEGAGSSLRAA